MLRDSADKLERHEYRERQLGEQMKKALSGLDKRQRNQDHNIDVVVNTLSKLDERLRNIESRLVEQGSERDKGTYTVDTMNESIQSWMTKIENMVRAQSERTEPTPISASRVDALEASISAKVDDIAAAVERLELHVLRPTPTAVSTQVVDTEAIISRVEEKLSQLQAAPKDDWQSSVMGALDSHGKVLSEMKQLSRSTSQNLELLATKGEVQQLLNATQDALQEIKYELVAESDRGVAKIESKIEEVQKGLGGGQEEIQKTVSDASVMAEGFYSDVQKSYEQLLKEVKGLAKVEQVMIQTADNVLDTKRRIEYGVHQILLEVGDLVKLQAKDLNSTVNRRFDDISETILDNQNGGLTNLSSKIETEISQVWRQIGIMYQQLTASADALDRLQQQTETYVNGSLQTMDSMEGKVGQITGRMSEVDDNLNYLLGRLSLVTQEFNQIKSGLGAALDNIRSSFLQVQDKVKSVGRGPNPIDSSVADDNLV